MLQDAHLFANRITLHLVKIRRAVPNLRAGRELRVAVLYPEHMR